MENDNTKLDLEVMKEFDEYVRQFTHEANAGISNLDEEVDLNIPYEELLSLSSQECLAKSFKITGYAIYIQGQVNDNQARLNFCEDSLNHIIAKYWNNYDPYMKYEIKRQAVILENSFASKIEKLRSRLKARLVILEDKVKDIRKLADTLADLGKRKGYNEHS